MTALKAISACIGSLLLIPVLVLSAVGGGFGDGSAAAGRSHREDVAIGDISELQDAVLSHPAIRLTAAARGDVGSGVVDVRVLQVLLLVAQTHELGPVGPLVTGHSHYVRGTSRVSNHVYGRAVDILGIDRRPVSPMNDAAREAMEQILTLPDFLLPDELGGPWVLSNGSMTTFTKDHLDHIHLGYRRSGS